MKIKAILKLLKEDGWEQVAQKGSPRQLKHPTKKEGLLFPIMARTLLFFKRLKTQY
jgi:predicted RNA binding protein YcfA (HicA-like mRNA interferase family)